MPIIKQMDGRLADMIAAGEVVDRPASIVKELVENAIDAKANRITIDIEAMGMKTIIVTDNGTGMDAEDAQLAFLRHATSKIAHPGDLNHIATLGFRGEALAAIAAVSKVTLKTRQKDAEGVYVTYHGGSLQGEGTATLNEGTVVEVNDLFFNTPARFKYIKSEQAEKYAIIDIFDRLALANPGIRLTLTMDGKLVKQTYGNNDFYALIDQIHGPRMTQDMTVFETEIQKIKLTGYLLSPQINRARKKDVHLFVNGRTIKNYALVQAVIDGYHSFLMVNRYPIALIHLELDPSLLDVNVHPQKTEVKFANESLLAYHIENQVKNALLKKSHKLPEGLKTITKETIGDIHIQQLDLDAPTRQQDKSVSESDTPKLPAFDYVGTYAGTYLIFQNEEGLFMMDQHAAEERIRYEHYFNALAHPVKATRHLMIPYPLRLLKRDLDHIRHYLAIFIAHGFDFDDEITLTGIPVWLFEDEVEIAIETMLSMLEEKAEIDLSTLRDHLAKDISCKGAIKANQPLSKIEIDALVERLKRCQNPYTCPHGRPTVIKLSEHEIERLFKRVI